MSFKILVIDSYHRTSVAIHLQAIFGDEAVIYCETNHSTNHTKSEHLMKRETDLMEDHPFVNQTDKSGFDLFFLSGLLITEKIISPFQLKQQFGSPFSKVIAMSVDTKHLDEIKEDMKHFGVDFLHLKKDLGVVPKAEEINSLERRMIREYQKSTCQEQQAALFYACETIRIAMLTHYHNTSPGQWANMQHLGSHSILHDQIHARNWTSLLENKMWLSLLMDAHNTFPADSDIRKKHLAIIAQFFPERTKEWLKRNQPV